MTQNQRIACQFAAEQPWRLTRPHALDGGLQNFIKKFHDPTLAGRVGSRLARKRQRIQPGLGLPGNAGEDHGNLEASVPVARAGDSAPSGPARRDSP